MEEFGFIRGKLEIKILILFIMNRLPEPVDIDTLADLTLCDAGINYFDYVECVYDLVRTGHIEEKDGLYLITDKGRKNGAITESTVPYSVRMKAEKNSENVAVTLKRKSLIKASHNFRENGDCIVHLSMDDGIDSVMSLDILSGGEALAKQIEENFQNNAEKLYTEIINILAGSN